VTAALVALAPGEELVDAASFSALWSSAAAPDRLGSAVRAPSVTPAAAATLEAALGAAPTRPEVTRIAAELAGAYAAAAAVFVVQRGMIQRVAGEGCDGRAEAVLFPAHLPSVFGEVVATAEPFHGAPPHGILERRILRALGREDVREIAVLPCALGPRVVTLLYADNGSEPLGEGALAALQSVGRSLARAYARLILTRRSRLRQRSVA
jgi:hypothetical protein